MSSASLERTYLKSLDAVLCFPRAGMDTLTLKWGVADYIIPAGEAEQMHAALKGTSNECGLALLSPWISAMRSEVDLIAFKNALEWFCDELEYHDKHSEIRFADINKRMGVSR